MFANSLRTVVDLLLLGVLEGCVLVFEEGYCSYNSYYIYACAHVCACACRGQGAMPSVVFSYLPYIFETRSWSLTESRIHRFG